MYQCIRRQNNSILDRAIKPPKSSSSASCTTTSSAPKSKAEKPENPPIFLGILSSSTTLGDKLLLATDSPILALLSVRVKSWNGNNVNTSIPRLLVS